MKIGHAANAASGKEVAAMPREDTMFQIMDFLTEEEMPYEALCDEMEQYHPQVLRREIAETLDYLLAEDYVRIMREQWIRDETGTDRLSRWHGLTDKGKANYYKMVKKRYPDD
jgi:hypothetical protein